MVNVQFSDNKKTEIVAYFCGVNSAKSWANLGEVSESDPRWLEYYNAQPLILRRLLPEPLQ